MGNIAENLNLGKRVLPPPAFMNSQNGCNFHMITPYPKNKYLSWFSYPKFSDHGK